MKLIIAGTDIETTGLLDAEHRIIEVHITRYLVDVAQPEIRDKIDERTWRIVGETESDVENGKISYKAPLARALIGKHEGDEVTVPTPGGSQTWEIIEVRYR